jgi:hypothetical protein
MRDLSKFKKKEGERVKIEKEEPCDKEDVQRKCREVNGNHYQP